METVELSIITAARDECGNVEPFLRGALAAIAELDVRAEIIFVDDGSRDGTGAAVEAFVRKHNATMIRLFRHRQASGLSAAMATGFAHVRGRLICLVPADLESLPEEDIPALYRAIDPQTDVVCGRRLRRADGKLLASRIYALANRLFFGVHVHDGNWIKLIRRERLYGVCLYPGWHRYLLAMLAAQGCRIKEVNTVWYPRQSGKSKFGLARIPAGIAGALAVKIFLGFRDRALLFSLWIAFWMGMFATILAATAMWNGRDGNFWLPGWVLCGTMVSGIIVAFGLGLALEFRRWADGPPEVTPIVDLNR